MNIDIDNIYQNICIHMKQIQELMNCIIFQIKIQRLFIILKERGQSI